MPKTSNEGPTYAGLVDVSPPETATPEWVAADSLPAAEPEPKADVSHETEPEHGRRSDARKAGKR